MQKPLNIDWKPADFIENSPKQQEIYLVCGVNPPRQTPFWGKAFYVYGYSFLASQPELTSEGPNAFDRHPETLLYYWPEGWYSYCDDDSSATPLPHPPAFFAEVDLPLQLFFPPRLL